MVYDNTYSVGEVFHSFLRTQTDVLNELRDTLRGKDPVGARVFHALLGRFEHWLDERGCVTDSAQRAMLMEVAQAFVDLAAEPEEAESLVLV